MLGLKIFSIYLYLKYELSFKSDWNLVSIPCKDYSISSARDVYSYVYVYDPIESSYKTININQANEIGKRGFWIYAYRDTTLEINGNQPLSPEDISLIAKKPNLIPVPKNGIKLMSQKGNCNLIKFYYYNSTDQTWYKWNATNGEYSKYNQDKKRYELVKVDNNPSTQEGLAIFIYTENECSFSSR